MSRSQALLEGLVHPTKEKKLHIVVKSSPGLKKISYLECWKWLRGLPWMFSVGWAVTERALLLRSRSNCCPWALPALPSSSSWSFSYVAAFERSAVQTSFWSGKHSQTCTGESYWSVSLWERLLSLLTSNYFCEAIDSVFKPKLIEPTSADFGVARGVG